jgi:hypothetical protein
VGGAARHADGDPIGVLSPPQLLLYQDIRAAEHLSPVERGREGSPMAHVGVQPESEIRECDTWNVYALVRIAASSSGRDRPRVEASI